MTVHLDSPAATRPATSINRVVALAGALAALTAFLHIVGGGITIARPLLTSSLPDEPRLVMYAVWHMASVVMSLSAITLLFGASGRFRDRTHYTIVFVGLLWTGFGLSFLGVALAEGYSNLLLNELSQWTLLLPVGLLSLWGSSRNQTPTLRSTPLGNTSA